MEFVLIHRMIGLAPPEVSKALIEIGKKRKELCPQAKEIVAYWSMFDQVGFCVWEAPSIEALAPLSQMANLGMKTEIIPVIKIDEALPKFEEAMSSLIINTLIFTFS